jgi:hypothetical protein
MRTSTLRIAPLAAACVLVALATWAAPAAAGTYTVSACTAAKRFGHQIPPTHAFVDLSGLPNVRTGGMYTRRACADFDGKPFGMVAGNVVRSGRVRPGHQAGS